MSLPVQQWAYGIRVGNPIYKSVLVALAFHSNDEGLECYPSQKTLAAELDIDERTIRNAIPVLQRMGLITQLSRGQGRGHKSSYQIHIDKAEPSSPYEDVKTGTPNLESGVKAESGAIKPEPHVVKAESHVVKAEPDAAAIEDARVNLTEPLEPKENLSFSGFFEIFYEIPGTIFDGSADAKLTAWFEEKGAAADLVEGTATAMKASLNYQHGRWRYKAASGWREYTDLRAVVRSWVGRDLRRDAERNGAKSNARRGKTQEERLEGYRQAAAREQANR